MQVIVDKLVTKYQKTGNGPTVLLLHGWGDNLNTYKGLTQELQSSYTLIALDLPGFGGTETPKKTFSLELYAKFVASFLEKTGSPELYAIVGHSNGGAIAIRALSSNILKSKKLVLLASSGIRNTYSKSRKLKRIVVKSLKIPTKMLPNSIQRRIKIKVYKKIGSDLFVAEHMQETFKQVITEDVVMDAKNIHQPTLLVYGSEDKSTPVIYGEALHNSIKNSQLFTIDGADHFLHHNHADAVHSLIKDFLG